MTYRQRNDLVNRAMELHDPKLRNGYYAGLAATIGRCEMDHIRRMADHRLAGGTDVAEVISIIGEAVRTLTGTLGALGATIAAAFRPGGEA